MSTFYISQHADDGLFGQHFDYDELIEYTSEYFLDNLQREIDMLDVSEVLEVWEDSEGEAPLLAAIIRLS